MSAENPDQTDVFGADEGDNWFRRNAASLREAGPHDIPIELLSNWNARRPVASICELGCSNGWRLGAIAKQLPQIKRLAGSDLSREAIENGRAQWPALELKVGSLDAPDLEGPFDVVIVSFVLHWVGRERLRTSIRTVDGLVCAGGALILADFLPDRPCARPYHHRGDVKVYTYKQDYGACFTALGSYKEIERRIFSHSHDPESIDEQDRAMCALLVKHCA